MAKGQAEGKRSEPANRSNEAVKAVKGLAWRFPVLKTQDLGKIGPGLGVGAGCGAGVSFGLFGGAGLGLGMPGLHFGVGAGVGCGIGLGFGYGVGKGVAFDENGKYTNVGKLFQRNLPSHHQIGALVDEVVFNAKRLVQATSKEIEKWR